MRIDYESVNGYRATTSELPPLSAYLDGASDPQFAAMEWAVRASRELRRKGLSRPDSADIPTEEAERRHKSRMASVSFNAAEIYRRRN